MADMLVRLYELPPLEGELGALAVNGVQVRRAILAEKPPVMAWVQIHVAAWAAEVEATFARLPISCFIALRGQDLLGFACYDGICRNFFGPTAVLQAERGRGIGRALLLAALHAQRAQGYAYSIIGGVGPAGFYAKTVGAMPIEGSTPGIYAGRLHDPPRG
ncbi:MAG: GNAT family N-acetyltransferase [Gemmatimonadota bacterium]